MEKEHIEFTVKSMDDAISGVVEIIVDTLVYPMQSIRCVA